MDDQSKPVKVRHEGRKCGECFFLGGAPIQGEGEVLHLCHYDDLRYAKDYPACTAFTEKMKP